MITYAADPYEPQRSRREMAEDAVKWQSCNECAADTDPDDAAPSCGSHVVCLSCYEWASLGCRDCNEVWREIAGDRADSLAYDMARDER